MNSLPVDKATEKGKQPKHITWVVTDAGCYNCTSHTLNHGYPRLRRNYKWVSIIRYLYSLKHGPIPGRMVVRHKCDNPLCINIDHLELGTRQDNIHDRVIRGRSKGSKGSKNGNVSLTEAQVIEILTKPGSISFWANKFGVNKTTIGSIKNRKTWKHLSV